MNKSKEDVILAKAQELEHREALMARYAETYGRDRWYNRGCHDITTLRQELALLKGTEVAETEAEKPLEDDQTSS